MNGAGVLHPPRGRRSALGFVLPPRDQTAPLTVEPIPWRCRLWKVVVLFACVFSDGLLGLATPSPQRGSFVSEGTLELPRVSSAAADARSSRSAVSVASAESVWQVLASCMTLRLRALFQRPLQAGETLATRTAEIPAALAVRSAFQLFVPDSSPPASPKLSIAPRSDAASPDEALAQTRSQEALEAVPPPVEELFESLKRLLQTEHSAGALAPPPDFLGGRPVIWPPHKEETKEAAGLAKSSEEERREASRALRGGKLLREHRAAAADAGIRRAAPSGSARAGAVVIVRPPLDSEASLALSAKSDFKSLVHPSFAEQLLRSPDARPGSAKTDGKSDRSASAEDDLAPPRVHLHEPQPQQPQQQQQQPHQQLQQPHAGARESPPSDGGSQ